MISMEALHGEEVFISPPHSLFAAIHRCTISILWHDGFYTSIDIDFF